MTKTPFFIAAYAMASIFTFGHSFSRQAETYALTTEVSAVNSDERRATFALAGAVAWPLYWSVAIQEGKR
jgi:hypothetical protein